MTRPLVPVFILGIELVVEIDQVIIEVVLEVILILVVLVFVIIQIFFVVIVVEILLVVEQLVFVLVVEIFIIYDLVFRIVTVGRTSRIVAIVYRVPLPRVAIFRDSFNRRLELVQHTITFLRVREAHAHVLLRVTASCDRSR